jgi:quinoprotein glucose dehydrogenase
MTENPGFRVVASGAAGILLGFFILSLFIVHGADTPKRPYTTWSDYGGAADSMQYSALKQIDKANVSKLALAWSYPVPDRKGNFGFNPVVADGVMYVLGQNNSIVALDAATGKQIWSHPVEGNIVSQRGINYWQSKDGADRRLIFGEGQYLTEVNARTGVSINTFGDDGRVNMRVGTPRPLGGPSATPGRVFENLILVGSQTGEGYGSAPGDVRAYDAITGKLVWDFHTIPHPGEFGYDTWPKDAWTYVGGVNTWGEISIDEKRGIAYFPLGSPTHDMYGGDRKGAGLFGDCLLALDIRTGKRLWHFQVVHHDLWDYDPTAAPKLLSVRHNGKMVDIVALPTKFGLLYVFNRVTGEPLWPIEERPVPQSDVPGEQSWPTQPFPTMPPPFARLKFTPDDINPYVDEEERAKLREIMLASRNEGLFTPQTLHRDQISSPGELGGSNWGGSAADPTTGMLYVRSADQPGFHTLREPGLREAGARGGGTGGNAAQRGRAAFLQLCQDCHGQAEATGIHSMDRATMIPVKDLGADRIRRTVRGGMGQMPPFENDTLTDANLDALIAYLLDPAAAGRGGGGGGGGGGGRNATPLPPPPDGVTRYTGPLGSMFRTANGLPAISPPWAQIVAYDLNEGTIKWRAPLGTVPALAAKGIRNTGNAQRAHRNGPAVTAGGLIFVGSFGDRTVHAYDKDDGKILWEHELEANPEGLAAVYEVGGREYVAFCASGTAQPDTAPTQNISFTPGKVAAQGYYVFALPKTSSSKK